MANEVSITKLNKSDRGKFCGIINRLSLRHFNQFLEEDEAMQPRFRSKETRYKGIMAALERQQIVHVH
ncbi:hypothetical protein P3342_011795 [Pyrenophora teres f. teres]|nr:hypothetical protein P3342_011795 [Pyrenophora teres f. teres]